MASERFVKRNMLGGFWRSDGGWTYFDLWPRLCILQHSCQPNLFIQNVFTDSHDPAFPVIAFFTNRWGRRRHWWLLILDSWGWLMWRLSLRVVKAGTELTWNYSADARGKQEVTCLCGSSGCQGQFSFEKNLCDACEVDGETRWHISRFTHSHWTWNHRNNYFWYWCNKKVWKLLYMLLFYE